MRRSKQRGAASLIVVMVLFFIMSLVAAYTSRNLIFEQRTSVNQYRSTQAHEAAEAGLEWALAQLNGGRIGGSCLEAGATNADTSFRQRYLGINTNPLPDPASGMITALTQAVAGSPQRRAGCVWTGVAWSCSCPSNTDPALPAQAAIGVFPAFWVSFSTNGVTRPGVVQIVVNGCTRLDAACLGSTANSIDIEGRALVTAVLALKSAITTTPVAALTVLGDPSFGAAPLLRAIVTNSDPSRGGITVHAGTPVVDTARFTLTSTPGTPGAVSVIQDDVSLRSLLDELPADLKPPILVPGFVPNDRAFASSFGAWPNSIRLQPGAVRLDCPAGGCGAALATAVAMNPDRVIWINGELAIGAGVVVGTAANPAVIVVAGNGVAVPGNVSLAADAIVNGVVYSRGSGPGPGPGPAITLTGPGIIQGAAFVEGNLTATAAPRIVFDGAVVDSLRLRAGSFVRVPGGWRDFQ